MRKDAAARVLNSDIAELNRNIKVVRLMILGRNEHFGMEEIMEDVNTRTKTVECTSTEGICYYISKEHFIHCVNLFKISN